MDHSLLFVTLRILLEVSLYILPSLRYDIEFWLSIVFVSDEIYIQSNLTLSKYVCTNNNFPTDFPNIFIQNQGRSFLLLFLKRDDELSSNFSVKVKLLDEHVRLQNMIENSSNYRLTWKMFVVDEKMLSIRVRSKIFQDHWYDHSRNNTIIRIK